MVHWQLSHWQLSALTVVPTDSCPHWQLSDLTVVRSYRCPIWQLISDSCLLTPSPCSNALQILLSQVVNEQCRKSRTFRMQLLAWKSVYFWHMSCLRIATWFKSMSCMLIVSHSGSFSFRIRSRWRWWIIRLDRKTMMRRRYTSATGIRHWYRWAAWFLRFEGEGHVNISQVKLKRTTIY